MAVALRVLIVDDYEPWRRCVRTVLHGQARYEIVGEACDGLEGLQKAQALEPDLILLDVGLPVLSGVEVAQRISACVPAGKILFISEHRSWDVVRSGLDAGGRGYLVKADVATDLLRALDAIAADGRFISESLWAKPASDCGPLSYVPHAHEARCYGGEAILVDAFADSLENELASGHACVIAALPAQLQRIDRALRSRGVPIDHALAEGRYQSVNAVQQAATFMVDGLPDEARFRAATLPFLHRAVEAATSARPHVIAYSVCAEHLWKLGRGDAAIRLEHLWNEITRPLDVRTICGFVLPLPSGVRDELIAQELAVSHSEFHSR
jgi:DNA-binding NarL/FixJ family response regulator